MQGLLACVFFPFLIFYFFTLFVALFGYAFAASRSPEIFYVEWAVHD